MSRMQKLECLRVFDFVCVCVCVEGGGVKRGESSHGSDFWSWTAVWLNDGGRVGVMEREMIKRR